MLAIKPVVNVKSVVSLFSLILLPLFLIGCNSSSSGSGAAPAVTGVTPSVVAPTVMLSGAPESYSRENSSTVAFEVTAQFSASVDDFVIADVVVSGATVEVTGSGQIHTISVMPNGMNEEIVISIATAKASGNTVRVPFVDLSISAPAYVCHTFGSNVPNEVRTTYSGAIILSVNIIFTESIEVTDVGAVAAPMVNGTNSIGADGGNNDNPNSRAFQYTIDSSYTDLITFDFPAGVVVDADGVGNDEAFTITIGHTDSSANNGTACL